MIYQLYKKNYGIDKGRVLAAVITEINVDDCKVYIFSLTDNIQLQIFEGLSMKINGEGRPFWAEITAPYSTRWKEITGLLQTPINIEECIEALNGNSKDVELIRLRAWFDDQIDAIK